MKKIIIIIGVLTLYFILGQILGFYLPCPFHYLTGYYCPGCGVTRMIVSIIKLDFYQAFRYNPLLFLFIPVIITYLFLQVRYETKGIKNVMNEKRFNKGWFIFVIIFVIYGVLRNTTYFSFLAPINVQG